MRYRVSLTRRTAENLDITVDARSEEEAAELALRLDAQQKGPRDWKPADWCGRAEVELVEEFA